MKPTIWLIWMTLLTFRAHAPLPDAERQLPRLISYFIYATEDADPIPCDTVDLYEFDWERSLGLYAHLDSFTVNMSNICYIHIFTFYAHKYALILDTNQGGSTQFYAYRNGAFARVATFPTAWSGWKPPELSFPRQNGDPWQDFRLRVSSGGTHGDDIVNLWYNPQAGWLEPKTVCMERG